MQPWKIRAVGGAALFLGWASAIPAQAQPPKPQKVLVYDKAGWYVHPEIGAITKFFHAMGTENGFSVDTGLKAVDFTAAKLAGYQVIVLNNISEMGTSLSQPAQRTAFQQYLENGGGVVGLHGTGVVRKTWDWFIQQQGSDWCYDAAMQAGKVVVPEKAKTHPINQGAPAEASLREEWNNFFVNVDTVPGITVVLSVDETSYDPTRKKLASECNNAAGFRMADPQGRWGHPVSWVRNVGQGRLFYSMIGHHMESVNTPFSKAHFLNAIKWAAGDLATTGVSFRHVSGGPGARLSGGRIEYPAGEEYRVEVFSMQGRKVLDLSGTGPRHLDLRPALPPGAYRVRTSAGRGSAARTENLALF